jgi:SAM-dependent methyltransferase
MDDELARAKEGGWREIAQIDTAYERGEIDDAGWHEAMAALVVPAYLAATTPEGGSGSSRDAIGWEYARSLLADAVERGQTFLDVGCANGFLIECLPRWTSFAIEPYGLDISPALAELARRRLPDRADRIFVGNALTWSSPHQFTFVRTGLDYVPRRRRRELVERLLGYTERVVVGVFNEHESERATEDDLASWGLEISGRSVRRNPWKPGMEYRVLWIDR